LGDRRRVDRLIQLAEQRGASPNASIPQGCDSAADSKAAYRFYENKAICPDAILASHTEATWGRIECSQVEYSQINGRSMKQESVVLAVQDTTQLDYTHHPGTTGLGMLHDTKHQGFLVHTTLAVTPNRVPLGIIQQEVWTRPLQQAGKKHQRKQRPIEEKESHKWIKSLKATAALQTENTRVVSVGDAEADVYELFVLSQQLNQDVLIRASHNRRVDHPERYLWNHMQSQPVAGTITVTLPRRPNQAAREATLSVRLAAVTLCPPQRPTEMKSKEIELESIRIWAVLVTEEQPPNGVEGISWLLLTSVAVNRFDDACERVQWYCCRWVIELYHKVLKSGCRVEERQFETAERLRRYLAVDAVVAWRVLYLTMLARDLPDMPSTAILEAHEWQALSCFIHQSASADVTAPTLRQAMHWIAKLGGFMGRKADGEPGTTVIWRGLQRLRDIAEAWRIFNLPQNKSTYLKTNHHGKKQVTTVTISNDVKASNDPQPLTKQTLQ